MKLSKRQLRRIIREAFEDIQAIIMRVRVDIDNPNDPSLQDILTTLRGLANVITVQQEKALEPSSGGRQMATLIVKFENSPAVDIPTLQAQTEALPTVDMVTIMTVDGREYDEEAGRRNAEVSRDAKALAFQKQRKLGQFAADLNFEGKMKITKGKLKKLIMEELARANLNEQENPWYAKIMELIQAELGPEGLKDNTDEIVDGLEQVRRDLETLHRGAMRENKK